MGMGDGTYWEYDPLLALVTAERSLDKIPHN
jgi:hypothetical protein